MGAIEKIIIHGEYIIFSLGFLRSLNDIPPSVMRVPQQHKYQIIRRQLSFSVSFIEFFIEF